MINFTKATSQADIAKIAHLAQSIWTAHYPPIIGQQQVSYMLENFQSTAAISKEIHSGSRYYIVEKNHQAIGYFAIIMSNPESIKISKLYIESQQQRSKTGQMIIQFIEDYALRHEISSIWLTVNRANRQAINFYVKQKFISEGVIVQDIGNGFIMDDYKMAKQLTP